MSTKIKIYIGIGAALFLIVAGYSLWSSVRMRRLENAAIETKAIGADHQKRADELERASRKYEEKIAFLEANLAELQTLARKQDEELKTIENTTGNARRDVGRARRIRTAAVTADEVCRKLAEVGHGCE